MGRFSFSEIIKLVLKSVVSMTICSILLAVGIIIFRDSNNQSKTKTINSFVSNNINTFESCEVKSVHDGDTVRLSCSGDIKKVRFACIDAPELAQPLGKESRDYLRSLTSSSVRIQPITTDKYGRTVAQLWNDKGLIQSQMALAGMAYPYERYSTDCPDWDAVTYSATLAQQEKKGVWDGDYEKPWEYRKNKNSR